MVTSQPGEVRIRYLENASELLLVASPVVSAHLQAERNYTSAEQNPGPSSSTQSCNACGNTLVLGWSCKKVRESPKPQPRRGVTGTTRDHPQTEKLCCSACGAVTVTKIKAPKPTARLHTQPGPRNPSFVIEPGSGITFHAKDTDTKPANRRSRTQKKSSLKALLTDKTSATSHKSHRFGLDLTDLMQR